MGSYKKCVPLFFVSLLLLSCDGFSKLFKTNLYENFDKADRVVIKSDDLKDWEEDDVEPNVLYYSDITLSKDDSQYFFYILKNDPKTREEILNNFASILDTYPDLSDPVAVDRYQKVAAALAKLEIYSTSATIVSGVDDLVVSYASGANEGDFNQETLLSEVFDVPPTGVPDEEREEKWEEVFIEMKAIMEAGLAYEKLGSTITDVDRPASNYISEEDAVVVLVSSMVNSIVDNTVNNESIEREKALELLVDGIVDGGFVESDTGPNLHFPTSPEDSAENKMVLYLGEGGALTFIATGFQLPPASSLGGS